MPGTPPFFMLSLQRGADGGEQVVERLVGGVLGVILLDLLRRAEQEARLAGLDHTQIVEAVAGGDRLIADGLQRADGRELRLLAAHLVAEDLAVRRDLERVAQQRRIAELLHQRHRELLERVAEDHDLRLAAQRVEKLLRAGHGVDLGDRLLNLLELQAVLFQDGDAVAHELIIVRLVAGGAAQLGDAARLGEGDPDFRDQNALHIQTNNVHFGFLLYFCSLLGLNFAQNVVEHGVLVDHVLVAHLLFAQGSEVLGNGGAGEGAELIHHRELVVARLLAQRGEHRRRELVGGRRGQNDDRRTVRLLHERIRRVPRDGRVRVADVAVLAPDAAHDLGGLRIVAAGAGENLVQPREHLVRDLIAALTKKEAFINSKYSSERNIGLIFAPSLRD